MNKFFKKLEFDESLNVTSDQKTVDEFIEDCKKSGVNIFLGDSDDRSKYQYLGVVYRQNIYNPVTDVKEFMYCGISSSTKLEKLFIRPMEDWYNPNKKYAGKKVENIRTKIAEGNYTCDTEILHVIHGNSREEVQKALNPLEVHYIAEIPESMKLNTARGGGNYTKGRRKPSVILENPHYVKKEEITDDTSFWVVMKSDLRDYKNGENFHYTFLSGRRIEKITFAEIKYGELSESVKLEINKENFKIYELPSSFLIPDNLKEELENIEELDFRSDWDLKSVPCIHIQYNNSGHIDFEKSKGYKTIRDCYKDNKSCGTYATVRNYVNDECEGFFKFGSFIQAYFKNYFGI